MKVSDAERQRIVGGCRCKEHWGLAETMIELHGDDFGLPRAPGHETVRLHVTTTGAPMVVRCDGSMTCPCERCVGERQQRIAQNQHGNAHRRQPWEAKIVARHG